MSWLQKYLTKCGLERVNPLNNSEEEYKSNDTTDSEVDITDLYLYINTTLHFQ
jgi:hypothetical protein